MAGLSVPEVKSIPVKSFKSLVDELKRFQKGLSGEDEVGIFANGAGLPLHVETVRSSGQMVVFSGVDSSARRACIIQHYTQVSIQIVALKKLEPEPRRIGF
jgi:hypothetical protein